MLHFLTFVLPLVYPSTHTYPSAVPHMQENESQIAPQKETNSMKWYLQGQQDLYS